VDPKVVELAMFKDIPHLMCPIVTEMSKAEAILDWAATKMDERYALLAEAGVKDIRSYNKLGKETLKERMQIENDEEMQHIPIKLPYLVLVIDELADLMMTSAKEVEFYLCRIAQKSRAVGIHLIVSTQRPQANVVTGLIKSNLPSRIAFRVASRLDSRIVLDQNGGEVLMGQGDMLFLPPGSSKLLRAQGTYISDEELRAIVKHARAQGEPNYHPELIRMPKAGEEIGERDELFDPAVDIILESGRGSVSLLQRRLTIGYSRASRLVEQMYAAGIVGEYKGSQAREVVVTKDEWQAIKAQRDREVAVEESGE
jgi:S-DNA-T family DNA segregation ATPase FtsK/SpoIIIE